jgi:hypothetical protein
LNQEDLLPDPELLKLLQETFIVGDERWQNTKRN